MAGTSWRPELPSKEKLENLLLDLQKINCETQRVIILMCKLMKMQLFNDGNKRLSMLIANHELIRLRKRNNISIRRE